MAVPPADPVLPCPPAGLAASIGRARRQLAALLAFGLLALLVGLAVGSVYVSPLTLLAALGGTADSATDGAPLANTVLALRLPRVLAAFASGGLLAVAGALMQVLLANPLGDPYVLGISGGAAVGALLVLWLGAGMLPVEGGAMIGAGLALALVLLLARRDWRDGAAGGNAPRLLLAGVVLAAGWSALITLILTLAPDQSLRGMLFWLMGDLAGATRWQAALLALGLLLLALRPLAADLNVLLRGGRQAFALGVDVPRRRLQICLLASLATAVAVTTAGTVGFLGLLVPHALRLLIGNDQRVLLPAAALLGGSLLVLADAAARTLLAPVQLPVGVLTALFGVPAFLILLARGRVAS